MSSTSAFFACLGLAALLTACGQKPDGTPYGVNPNKLDKRPAKPSADSARTSNDPYAKGMPKGAELNAVTNGASAGRPMSK